MIPQPARTFFLVVLATAFLSDLPGRSVLSEDPNAVSLPLEIELNGKSSGEVLIRSDPSLQVVEIEGLQLKELLSERVTPDLISLVESLPEGFHTLETYQELGLEIYLDLERLVIALQIQERAAHLDHGPKAIQLGYQRDPNYDTHSKQALFSGYANFRFRSSLDANENHASQANHQLAISHALNLSGYALEGESTWTQEAGFTTRELRLVKDFPQRLWRITAGDISTPINELQRGFQLFGFNIAKEFGIQPYRTFTPTSSASFDLSEESTVKVYLNGNHAKTLRLDPGSYDIEDFKLAAGPNKMDLAISTQSGLMDRISISEFGATHLLDAGVSTYSLSYGFPRSSANASESKAVNSSKWYERYVEDSPVLSGYYKRGLTNQLTASLDAQGSADWNRIGASLQSASERLGSLNLALSQNRTSASESSLSTRLTWARNIAGYQFSLSSLHSDNGFNLLKADQTARDSEIRSSSSLSVSKLFFEKLNVSGNFLHQSKHDGSQSQTVNLKFGRRLGKLYASLNLRQQTSQSFGTETSAYLTCTWNPAKRWRANSRIGMSNREGGTGISTNLDYSNRRVNDYVNARLNTDYNDSGYDLSGSFDYQTDLYALSLSHNQIYGAIDDYVNKGSYTTFSANSAIAFADGAWGFAERVRDSFAIVSKHSAWGGVQLGINPTLGGFERRNVNRFMSPVLTTLSPYRETYATVQTIDSDLFLNRNDYYFFPGYKRGINLKLGDDAIYALRGTLLYSDEEPVAYKAVSFTDKKGNSVETFTNRVGRFMATGLKPGSYQISVAGTRERLQVEVEKGEIMQVAGTLTLQTLQ